MTGTASSSSQGVTDIAKDETIGSQELIKELIAVLSKKL
jgi:hypothetical protein